MRPDEAERPATTRQEARHYHCLGLVAAWATEEESQWTSGHPAIASRWLLPASCGQERQPQRKAAILGIGGGVTATA